MTWREGLARSGLVAKGVSYGIVGVLALAVAVGAGGKATSRQGALATLSGNALGAVLLVLLALGFAAYAAWRALEAASPSGDDDGAKGAAKRLGYAGRAAIYAALTFSTLKILTGSHGGESQNGKAHHATAQVLSWPAGTWLVGIAGAVVVGAGLYNGYRGVSRSFCKHWRGGLGDAARRWGTRAGVVGLLARMIVFALIGAFAIKAAVEYDPKDAVGLDGALQKLAHTGYGPALLGLTAAGLVAYGLFCVVDARYREV